MSLHVAKSREDIPPGAKIVDRKDAFAMKYQAIVDHKPVSDVLALKYGGLVLGFGAAISGAVLLSHFRRSYGLRKEAQISSIVACGFLPGMMSFMYHFLFALPPTVLQEPICRVCLELKGAGIQLLTATAGPSVIGLLTASFTAQSVGSYVPPLKTPAQIYKLGSMLIQHNNGVKKVVGLSLVNMIAAMGIINAEEIQLHQFNRRQNARRLMAGQS